MTIGAWVWVLIEPREDEVIARVQGFGGSVAGGDVRRRADVDNVGAGDGHRTRRQHLAITILRSRPCRR